MSAFHYFRKKFPDARAFVDERHSIVGQVLGIGTESSVRDPNDASKSRKIYVVEGREGREQLTIDWLESSTTGYEFYIGVTSLGSSGRLNPITEDLLRKNNYQRIPTR